MARKVSRASLRGLDAFAFFLADIQTGWGPFVAAYLTSVGWLQFDIGLILTIGTMAGFVLQIDDPRMATHYNRTVNTSIEDCRRFIALRVEAVNHALRGIPEDRVRFHTCYSVNIAPRVHDFELKHFVDLMLQIRAAAYLIEAANPRHEHEWQLWQDVKLPEGKILVPGVVSHCIHLVEHPELVAQRIVRFAEVVGRERVIAGTDCGFGTSGAGDEVHPEVAWAKLRAMVEGARIASDRLWA